MKKCLFVATVVKKHINVFHLPYLKMFQEKGWETSVCARNDFEESETCEIPHCDRYYDFPFERFPLKKNNLKTFLKLRKLILKEKYNLIHCHTPSAAVLTRLAAKKARKKYGTRVLYTAHGFHFFKGAPLINWLLYFPMEWICSFFTDTLITINQEDFARAKKLLHARETVYVPGVGVDTDKFSAASEDRAESRAALGIPEDGVMLLSVGELSKRKNQKTIIEAMGRLQDKNIYYFIAGVGGEEAALRVLAASHGLEDNVRFLGFRSDIPALCRAADIFCFPSLQEGLPVALMEAMGIGLPAVASAIRGNEDLLQNGEGGYLYAPTDVQGFSEGIRKLANDPDLRVKMGQNNAKQIKAFDIKIVSEKMQKIYTGERRGV